MKSIAVSSDIRKDGVLGQGLLSGASDPLASASAGTFDFDEPARLAAEKSKASARRARCQLIWAMVFCVMFMIAEVVGGYLAKSLAIMTDAAHLLSDVASFSISLFAVWLAERPPTAFATFGFHRIEIFGALASVLLIWVLTGVLCYEAVQRIITPEDVDGRTMFIVAVLGVVVNIIMMKILSSSGGGGHGHSHGGEGGGAGEHGHSHDVVGLFKKMIKGKGQGKAAVAATSSSIGHGHSHGAGEARHKPLLAAGAAATAGYGSLPDSEAASPVAGAGAEDEGHGHSHGAAVLAGADAHEAEAHGHSHGSGSNGGEEEENLNVRAAFIHALGDLVQSVGVVIAAIIIWAKPEARIADPICTFLFSILVLFTTFGVVKTGLRTLLNSTPAHINLRALASDLMAIPGVANVHDLHVFGYGANRVALTVHLVADDPPAALEAAQRIAKGFGIQHSTVQVERCSSMDIQHCYSFNAHIGACKLTLEDVTTTAGGKGSGSGHGHSHSHSHGHGHSHGHSHGLTVATGSGIGGAIGSAGAGCDSSGCTAADAGGAASISGAPVPVVLDRPSPMSRHDGPGGCGAMIATPVAAASARAALPAAASVTTVADAAAHSHVHRR